jgi:acetyl-CoA acetyltransferase
LVADGGTSIFHLFATSARKYVMSSPHGQIAIVGVGETEFRRQIDRSTLDLVVEAALAALDEAGLEPGAVDGIVTEASSMPQLVPADEVAMALGVKNRTFTASALIGGAGVVGAPDLAQMAINAGRATTVLTFFGSDFGSSPGGPYAFPAALDTKLGVERPAGWYGQPAIFAQLAQRYRHQYGLKPEQQGAIVVGTRQHAAHTPGAMKREPLSVDDYLSSPMIADPFRSLDCSLINDGASAWVMTSAERARDLKKPPVLVAGCGIGSLPTTQASYFSQKADYLATPARVSAPRAFEGSGLMLDDVDFAEIYDCFTISLLLQLEDLGFSEPGSAADLFESGRTAIDGSLPVNTHGGLLSYAYTVGASHVVEAVRQIRGERSENQVASPEVALVAGLGVPDHATLLLTKDR